MCAGVAVLPLLQTGILTRAAFGRTLSDFSPYLNDEVSYWHEIATFAHAGFDGGYYSFAERVAPVGRFGTHGPAFAVLFGSAARATGWHRDSGPRFNAAVLGAALLVFAAVTRVPLRRLALLVAIVLTFWPVAYWVPSTMQEPLHYSAAIVMGGLVARALAEGPRLHRAASAAGWLLSAVLVVIRPSWTIVLVVWAIAAGNRRGPRLAARVAAAVLIGAALTAAFFQISAPIPTTSITTADFMLAGGLPSLAGRAGENLERLVKFDDFERIELWHRAVYLAAALGSCIALAAAAGRYRRGAVSTDGLRHAAVHVVNVGGIIAAMLLMYAISNMTEFRIIAAHVLLSASVLAARGGRLAGAVLAALLAANAAAAGIFWEDFRQNRGAAFRRDLRSQRVFEEILEGRIVFDPAADPWCNTLLAAQYPPDLVSLPPGIGISAVLDATRVHLPVKSRYLLLDARTHERLAPTMTLEHLGDLPYGSVYVNRSAACAPAPPPGS